MSLVDRKDENELIESMNVDQDLNQWNSEIGPKRSIFWIIKAITISLVVIFVIYILGKGFYKASHEVYVDNSFDQDITIQINDMEEIDVPAFSHKIISLWAWEYTLSVNGEKIWEFEKKSWDRNAILNPLNDIYITEQVIYWDSSYIDILPSNVIEAFGNKAEGPFVTYDWIYFQWNWNYDLDQTLPEEINLRENEKYKIKTKLYRFTDFAEMYNRDYLIDEALDDSETIDDSQEVEGTQLLNDNEKENEMNIDSIIESVIK